MKRINYQSKSEHVYNQIKDAILDGRMLPTQRLVISDIAKELGVSEIPVRDAIAKLKAEGLLEMGLHNRAIVSRVSVDDLKDTLEMRIILEPLCAKMATPHIQPSTIHKLQCQVDLMNQYIENNDFSNFGKANRTFHALIYDYCQNKLMVQMIEELYQKSNRARAIFNIEHERGRESNQEHQLIVDAIKQHDEDAVYQLMHEQKSVSLRLFLKVVSEKGYSN